MILAVRVLHVAVAAAWFGHKLLVPSDLRRSLSGDIEAADLLIPRLARAESLGVGTGIGTLATGLLLVVLAGPRSVAWPIWIGLALVVVAILVGALVARPASIRLRSAVNDQDLPTARQAARRLSNVLIAEGVLWTGALVSMLV